MRVAPGTQARQGYLAGDDGARAAALNQLVRDPDVRAIIAARGGYGLMRILDRLDADALRRDPKILVGFSDVTALLCWAQARANLRCIHGPMVAQLGDLPESDVTWLYRIMEDKRPPGPLDLALQPIGARADGDAGAVEGPLLGGNLCLLSHLLGTRYALDFTGAVLLFEDVGERPYRIDRYLTHLGLAGALRSSAAAVVGELTDCVETANDDHPGALEVVDERLGQYGIPGLGGLPLAHGRRNLALPMGARCAFDQSRGRVHLLEAAVS